MNWIELTDETGEIVFVNSQAFVMAKSDARGTGLVCRETGQSLTIREDVIAVAAALNNGDRIRDAAL